MYKRARWKRLPTSLLRSVARPGLAPPVAWMYLHFVVSVYDSSTGWRRIKKKDLQDRSVPTFLALYAEAFRGDLEALAKTGQVRILKLNLSGMHRLTYVFLEPFIIDGKMPDPVRFYHASEKVDPEFQLSIEKAGRFLGEIVTNLKRWIGLDGILLHNVRHTVPLIWARAAKNQDLLYAVIYREGSGYTDHAFNFSVERHRKFGTFQGDVVFVKNKRVRDGFLESRFAREEQVVVAGDPRFDQFLGRLDEIRSTERKKQVTLFGWHANAIEGGQFERFTGEVYLAVAELAEMHPDIQFICKFKPEHMQSYKAGSKQIDIGSIFDQGFPGWRGKNLILTDSADVEQLITNSKVIIGFQSTALLEASVARRYVLIPFFEEFLNSVERARLGFLPILDLFDTAKDTNDFKAKVLAGLQGVDISIDLLAARESVFSERVADLTGMSASNVAQELLEKVLKNDSGDAVSEDRVREGR